MKIAVTSTGPTLDYYVGTRAGNCPYLLIIDPDTMRYEAMQNPAIALRGPAARKLFTQLLLQNRVSTVLAPSRNSRMLELLDGTDVAILSGISGSVRNAIETFKCSNYSMVS